MKKIIAVYLAVLASTAWACTTHTVVSGGRIVTCTTCCFGNNCQTNCF